MKENEGEVQKALALRQDLSKSSVKKYSAMQSAVCSDGRARGLIQFYGANLTGRYAGRLIQVQNLPQNHIEELGVARELIRTGRFDKAGEKYGSVPALLSELIRTAFVPKAGSEFCAVDFSAIEARVIAWLANEKWRMEVFKNGGDIYAASVPKCFTCRSKRTE